MSDKVARSKFAVLVFLVQFKCIMSSAELRTDSPQPMKFFAVVLFAAMAFELRVLGRWFFFGVHGTLSIIKMELNWSVGSIFK